MWTPRTQTDLEKLAAWAQWNPFAANAGTYEIRGGNVITHPLVAKNESLIDPPQDIPHDFRIEGDTLWYQRPGGTRYKLIKIE